MLAEIEQAENAGFSLSPTSSSPDTPRQPAIGEKSQVYMSPTGRTAWSYDAQGNLVNEKPLRVVPRMGPGASTTDLIQYTPPRDRQWQSVPTAYTPEMWDLSMADQRSASYAGPSYGRRHDVRHDSHIKSITAEQKDTQEVNIDRIANGHDVRTTVMIRNVPNEWTCDDVKQALDSAW